MTGIDWSNCPIVERNPNKMGGVPTVRAYRMSADSVVQNYESGATPEEISNWFDLPIEDVRTIIAYAEQAHLIAHPL